LKTYKHAVHQECAAEGAFKKKENNLLGRVNNSKVGAMAKPQNPGTQIIKLLL